MDGFPSSKVDVKTALRLLDWSWYRFSRSCETLPLGTAQQVLRALGKRRGAGAVFLRAAVDPDDLLGTWRPAVVALRAFQAQYAWGSKQKRASLEPLARAPRMLAAVQAAAACRDAPLEMLAVLALDASEESADALMPHFHRATAKGGDLEQFARLRPWVKDTAWTRQMLSAVGERQQSKRAGSPVLRLATKLGIASGPVFRVALVIRGAPLAKGRPAAVRLFLDSREEPTVWVTPNSDREGSRSRVVKCAVERLPAMFERESAKLKVLWNFHEAEATYLRGRRLQLLCDWLADG